jgi:poly(A) polymerase
MADIAAMERKVFEAFGDAGLEVYLVGGCVRDRLSDRPAGDLDFATNAEPGRTAGILESLGLSVYTVGARFGTVSASVSPGAAGRIEVTTYRSEVYRKGSRKPEVRFGLRLEDDLVRRDFTVNAMAMDGDGCLVDPCGGLEDLRAGILRTPLDPMVTMSEDPLRMLRAARFGGRFGFRLAEGLAEAIRSSAGELAIVSVERQLMELDGLLGLPDGRGAAHGLRLLDDCGMMEAVLPELVPLRDLRGRPPAGWHNLTIWDHTLLTVRNASPMLTVRWAALLHDCGKPASVSTGEDGFDSYIGHERVGSELAEVIGHRLRFPAKRRAAVARLVGLHMRPALFDGSWTDSAIRRLAGDAGELLPELISLSRADAMAMSPEASRSRLAQLDILERRLAAVSERLAARPFPPDLGERLRSTLFTEPSDAPRMGEALRRLLDLVADGKLPAGRDASFYVDYLRKNP